MRKVIERKREDERLRLLGEATYQQLNVQGMVCKDITCRKGLESTESKTTKNWFLYCASGAIYTRPPGEKRRGKRKKRKEKRRKEKGKRKRKKETIRDVERDSAACSTMHASNGVVLCHPGAARMTFLPLIP